MTSRHPQKKDGRMVVEITLGNTPPRAIELVERDYGGYSTVYEGLVEPMATETVLINLMDGRQGRPGRAIVELKGQNGQGNCRQTLPIESLSDWAELTFQIELEPNRFSFEASFNRPDVKVKLRYLRGPYVLS